MYNITRSGIVFAMTTLLFSCADNLTQEEKSTPPSLETISQQERYVGRWEATVEGLTVSLLLRENHECLFDIPDGTVEGTWSASGQNLTVDIPDTPSMGGETFHGLHKTIGDELEFWEEGSEHVILKRVIDTPEIVRILEQERIRSIGTTHAQRIGITLEDGRRYRGVYVYAEAGKYADDKDLIDILNLVMHIKKKRPPEEVEGWEMTME